MPKLENSRFNGVVRIEKTWKLTYRHTYKHSVGKRLYTRYVLFHGDSTNLFFGGKTRAYRNEKMKLDIYFKLYLYVDKGNRDNPTISKIFQLLHICLNSLMFPPIVYHLIVTLTPRDIRFVQKWVRLATNGTNLGLFHIRFVSGMSDLAQNGSDCQ